MPSLLAEILNFQGSTHRYGVGSFSIELIKLLGQEFTLKEASNILNKPQRTLYGWIQTLRPIFKEYMQTIVHNYI